MFALLLLQSDQKVRDPTCDDFDTDDDAESVASAAHEDQDDESSDHESEDDKPDRGDGAAAKKIARAKAAAIANADRKDAMR